MLVECPKCGSNSKVIDSRKYAGAVYRKRKCVFCNFKFWTEETELDDNDRILKDMQACYKMKTRDKERSVSKYV